VPRSFPCSDFDPIQGLKQGATHAIRELPRRYEIEPPCLPLRPTGHSHSGAVNQWLWWGRGGPRIVPLPIEERPGTVPG
jgi:hypothetical protein